MLNLNILTPFCHTVLLSFDVDRLRNEPVILIKEERGAVRREPRSWDSAKLDAFCPGAAQALTEINLSGGDAHGLLRSTRQNDAVAGDEIIIKNASSIRINPFKDRKRATILYNENTSLVIIRHLHGEVLQEDVPIIFSGGEDGLVDEPGVTIEAI